MRYSECPLCGKKRHVELYCDCDKGGVIGGPDLDQLEKDAVLGAATRKAALSGFSNSEALDFARAQARTFGAKSMLVSRDVWRAIAAALEAEAKEGQDATRH